MTDYALVGKKGTGKSKHAVLLMRDRYLRKKRLVATNLDLDLGVMFGSQSRLCYVRVPDKPSSFDLMAVGHGNPGSYDEDNNGALVLDEMATWLNARTFGDRDRAAVLDFFAHARKHGFDTYYIMQDVSQIDKQVRESFLEQTVRHRAYKRVRVPFIGWILSGLFGERAGFMPNFHRAIYRMGVNPQDLVVNSLMFTGRDVEAAYDTRQVFREDYPHGTHTVLSPWHVKGRFEAAAAPSWWRLFVGSNLPRSVSALLGGVAVPVRGTAVRPVAPVDPVMVRAAWFARRLPAARRVAFVNAYVRSCAAVAASRAVSAGAPGPSPCEAGQRAGAAGLKYSIPDISTT